MPNAYQYSPFGIKKGNITSKLNKAFVLNNNGTDYGNVFGAGGGFIVDQNNFMSLFNGNGLKSAGYPQLSYTQEVIGDTSFTVVAPDQVETGVDLAAAGASVAGYTTAFLNTTFAIIKQADVIADEAGYFVVALSNGITTNSIAHLIVPGGGPANLTSTAGIIKVVRYYSQVDPGSAGFTGFVGQPQMGQGYNPSYNGTPFGIFNDGGQFQFLSQVLNISPLYSPGGGGPMDYAANIGLFDLSGYFGPANDTPLIRMGSANDAPDIVFSQRGSDPTLSLLNPWDAGGMWYNNTSKQFKYWDGAAIQTMGVGSIGLQEAYNNGRDVLVTGGMGYGIKFTSFSPTKYGNSSGFIGFFTDTYQMHLTSIPVSGPPPIFFVNKLNNPVDVEDEPFTVIAPDRIQFANTINFLNAGLGLSGFQGNSNTGVVFIKTADVAADVAFYGVVGVASGGGGTNNVLIMTAVGGSPINLTATSGTATVGNWYGARGFINVNTATSDMGRAVSGGQLMRYVNDGGRLDNILSLANYPRLNNLTEVSTSILQIENYESNSLVPLIKLYQDENYGDIQFTTRSSDPTGLAAGDEGLMWYNASTNLFKYWDGVSIKNFAGSLDNAYENGDAIVADSGAVSITVPNAASNACLQLIQNDITFNPNALEITNTGNGYDVRGSASSWYVTRLGQGNFNTLNIGGGYGSGGLSIDTDGHLRTDTNLEADGYITTGGGYSGTGVTIETDGDLQMKGDLTVDLGATFGGGYSSGTGTDILSDGNIQTNRDILTDQAFISTTSVGCSFIANNTTTSVNNVVEINATGAGNAAKDILKINANMTSYGNGLSIAATGSKSTVGFFLNESGSVVSTLGARNDAAVGNAFHAEINNASNTYTAMYLAHNGSGWGVYINHTGTGKGLKIDVATLTERGLEVVADSLTTGQLASFTSNSASAAARNLFEIKNTNIGATGTNLLYLDNLNSGSIYDVSGNHWKVTSDGKGDFSEASLRLQVDTTDISNPPTDAELDAIFGTPATVGSGFTAYVDDNGADTNVYLVMSNGSSWWYSSLTKAV
jgi:hypothetical protein